MLVLRTHDDIILMGDYSCYQGSGRFFNEFSDLAVNHSMCMADINELRTNSYTYISSNASLATS